VNIKRAALRQREQVSWFLIFEDLRIPLGNRMVFNEEWKDVRIVCLCSPQTHEASRRCRKKESVSIDFLT